MRRTSRGYISLTKPAELSPNKRAGCHNGECKKAGIKLQKGEARFGSMVTINEKSSYQYRHWYISSDTHGCFLNANNRRGCVTPVVVSNIRDFIDGDFEMIDGFEEMPADWQDKIKRAVEQGHVDDEDWKGVSTFITHPIIYPTFLKLDSHTISGRGEEPPRPEGIPSEPG